MQKFSECCSSPVYGELSSDGFGRCSECKEMSKTWTDADELIEEIDNENA